MSTLEKILEKLESCRASHQNHSLHFQDGLFCPAMWDLMLCWPPSPAGHEAYMACPPISGIDPTKFAVRKCSENGRWEDRNGTTGAGTIVRELEGYTDFNDCYLPETRDLFNKLDNQEDEEAIIRVAQTTRLLELTGLSVSLFSLIISLFIFTHFRSLQNHRTRIHKNLFAAIGIQVVIRLIIYVDQVIHPRTGTTHPSESGITLNSSNVDQGVHSIAILCRLFYVALEYGRTTMFVWMFIEGLYLHNLITVMVFQPDTYHKLYLLLGWGIPIVLTAIFAAITSSQYPSTGCWLNYNFTKVYWILEGPRLAIILVNLILLLNIIRVLVTKLRDSQCNEAEQLRKAVKAAIVLLPLLGITNVVSMIEAPMERSPIEFALWCYSSHFLTSFQGFFVSLIYCFLNGEVRMTLSKKLRNYLTDRRLATSLLGSRGISAYHSTQTETERDDHHEKHPRHLLRALRTEIQPERSSNGPTVTTQV